MSPSEMNEFCAREMGWQLRPIRGSRTVSDDEDGCPCCTPSHEVKYERDIWHAPGCHCADYIATMDCIKNDPPNYLTDETANAGLLEAILAKGVVTIGRQLDLGDEGKYFFGLHTHPFEFAADRKTSIVLAFIAWKKV